MYKKIKQQVADQTRPDIGFAKVKNSRGFNFLNIRKVKTIEDDLTPNDLPDSLFLWTKRYYLFDRTSRKTDVGRREDGAPLLSLSTHYHVVPVLDASIYAVNYPQAQYLKDYFVFEEFANVSESSTKEREIDGKDTGSFLDKALPQDVNICYTIDVRGANINESIPINISGDDVSVSVWVDDDNGKFLLYSSDNRGLTGWQEIFLPISKEGSKIYIFVYSHDDTDYTITDKFFAVQADFKRRIDPASDPNLGLSRTPTWGTPPIITSADPQTDTPMNILKFDKGTDPFWEKIGVYRRDYVPFDLEGHIDNALYYDNILTNAGSAKFFPPGGVVEIGGNDEGIKGALTAYGNKVHNADFALYTGQAIDSWKTFHTSGANDGSNEATLHSNRWATAIPYFGDGLFNGQCCKMYSLATDTTKTFYIEHEDAISLADWGYVNHYLSFYFKSLESGHTPSLKLLFYDDYSKTPCSVSSSLFTNLDDYATGIDGISGEGVGWLHFKAELDTPLGSGYSDSPQDKKIYLPTNCSSFSIRIYSDIGDTEKRNYLLDGFHVGDMSIDYIFDTTYSATMPSNKTAIQLTGNFEKPRNQNTTFYSYFDDTTKSFVDDTLWATSVLGVERFINEDNYEGKAKFDYGIEVVDSARNYLANGDFSGGIEFWSTSHGFYITEIEETTPFNDRYVKFYGFGQDSDPSVLQQSSGNAGSNMAEGPWCFSIWAKSRIKGQLFRMRIQDHRDQNSQGMKTLTEEWAKYDFSVSEDILLGHTVTAAIHIPPGRSWEMDIAGAQLEKGFSLPQFSYSNTSQGAFRESGGVRYDDADVIDDDYGTVRMWFTPYLNSIDIRNSTTSPSDMGLFFAGNGSAYKSIYWDYIGQRFVFRQYDGADYTYSYVSTSGGFKALDKLHIVATWDTGDSYLYVNNVKSVEENTPIDINATVFYLGMNAPSMDSCNFANGIISGFRIDKFTWQDKDVTADYFGDRKLFDDGLTVYSVDDDYLGWKLIDYNEPYTRFVDAKDLEFDKEYGYVFDSINRDGVKSAKSTRELITTTRKDHRYASFNLTANGSFEVVDYFTDLPLYWEKGGSATLSTAYYFKNDYSAEIGVGYSWTSEFISIADSSLPHYISYYHMNGDNVEVHIYSDRFDYLGEADDIFPSDDPARGDFPTIETGMDGNAWQRSYIKLAAEYAKNSQGAGRHWKIKLKGGSGPIRYDCIQTEPWDGTAADNEWEKIRSYREGYYVGMGGNLHYNAIDGNAIAFDSLVGRHFQAGEIVVSGHSSDANRIWVGDYSGAFAFCEIAPEYMKFRGPLYEGHNRALVEINSTAFFIGRDTTEEDDGFFRATAGGISIGASGGESFININPESINFGSAFSIFTATSLTMRDATDSVDYIRITQNKMVVGSESSHTQYMALDKNDIYMHSPGMDLGTGLRFAKHIEMGEATFGDNVEFSDRYVTSKGAPVTPFVFIAPKNIMTFSTANWPVSTDGLLSSVSTQNISMGISGSSAGGFNSEAYLYSTAMASYTQDNLSIALNCTKTSTKVKGMESLNDISTAESGSFSVSVHDTVNEEDKYDGMIKLYCTANAGASIGTYDEWPLLTTKGFSGPINGTTTYIMGFNHSNYKGAVKVVMELSVVELVQSGETVYADANYVTYVTGQTMQAIKSNEEIGTFSWFSMDGGEVG